MYIYIYKYIYIYIDRYIYIYMYIYIYTGGEMCTIYIYIGSCASRSTQCGNPRYYATFLDESLNLTLRDCAARSHRNTMEKRIFRLFALQGALGHLFLFGEKVD